MVELKVLDLENNDIDISNGLDFGLSRVGIDNILAFKLKNDGTGTASDVTLTSETLNTIEEVGEEEYNKQLTATKWKTFSLKKDGTFLSTLTIGDIKSGAFVEGEKETPIDFSSQQACSWSSVWENGITTYVGGKHVFNKGKDVHLGIMGKRMRNNLITTARDVEIGMNMDFRCTTEGQSNTLPFVGIPVKINSKGNGKGYMFMFQFRRNDNKFKVTIYKDAKGMTSYEDRDYGKATFDTITWTEFDKNKKISFKVYDNKIGKPTFEVLYDGKNIKLGKVGDSSINGFSMTDNTSSAYSGAGEFYWETSLYDGDYSVTTENMLLKTEELEQPIYIKTHVGENSINRSEYLTATTITYVEG